MNVDVLTARVARCVQDVIAGGRCIPPLWYPACCSGATTLAVRINSVILHGRNNEPAQVQTMRQNMVPSGEAKHLPHLQNQLLGHTPDEERSLRQVEADTLLR